MTPESLEGLTPQEAAAKALEWVIERRMLPSWTWPEIHAKAAELRAHKTAQRGTYWLIERESHPAYWLHGVQWTGNVTQATRFARKEHAEAMPIAQEPGIRVCEHMDVTGPSEWERECADTDELLRLIGLDPEACRTDGGSLNMARIKHLLKPAQEPVGFINERGEPVLEKVSAERARFLAFNAGLQLLYTRPAAMGEALKLLKRAIPLLNGMTLAHDEAILDIELFISKHGGGHE